MFWDDVSPKLDQLHLGSEQRTKIEQSIGKVIARVPEDEAAACREYMRKVELMHRLQRYGLL
jgi:hypothetical protein